jgi:diaminopropionate ammonia-lyase
MSHTWTDNPLFDAGAGSSAPWRNVLPPQGARLAYDTIRQWPGYAPTPLRALAPLAAELGIGAVCLKDEATRFGLGSFKALGGAYAVQRLVATVENPADLTVTCATDGNHGRAVAWGARTFGCRTVILIHATVSEGRKRAIEAYGAEVRRIDGTYDDSVRAAQDLADANGWIVVSDTSYPGYEDIPRDVMQGYSVMAREALAQMTATVGPPTHLFLQAGVGAFAAAVIAVVAEAAAPELPVFVAVEPERAACVVESLRLRRRTEVTGDLETIMAGLSCGEVSMLAWDILAPCLTGAMTVPEGDVPRAMRELAAGHWGDVPIVTGESGVAGLAGALRACADSDLRRRLALGPDSRILVFGTEGATDPELYQSIVCRPADEVAGSAA